MDKRGVALFLMILVLMLPTVEAFSFSDIFNSIGDFFGKLFGKKTVGIQQQCECITDDNCDTGYYCKTEGIVCDPPYMSEFNGLCIEELISQSYTLTATPTSGTALLTVNFNLEGNFPLNTQFIWYFGDTTQTTTTSQVQHTYQVGNYNARVRILQPGMSPVYSNYVAINVTSPPSYTLTANPISGIEPLNVSFLVEGDFIIGTQFTWYFGDQTITNSLSSMSHTYIAGNYNARVRILQPGMSPVYSNYVAISVTSTSQQQNYTLTVVKSGSGTVTGTSNPIQTNINCGSICSLPYTSGTIVTLTATPSTGYTFSHWEGDCSGTGSCNITMNSNQIVTAVFSQQLYTLTVTKSGTGEGSVSSNPSGINCGTDCSQAYAQGTNVILTAIPMDGSTFAGWTGGICNSQSTTCTVIMNSNKSVGVIFNTQLTYYTLTASPLSGVVPLTIFFTVIENQISPNTTNTTSLSPTGNIILPQLIYEWHFGDTNITNTITNTIQHTYQSAGNYIAFVNIKQDDEIVGVSNSVEIDVTSPPGPGDGGSGGGGGAGDGGGSGGGGCIPQWSCTLWSSCSTETNTQTRTCSDFNDCNTNVGKPSETQSCTPTLADQLGISSIGEDVGGEIQEFIGEGSKLKSTYIALILLFILIIVCSLLIYFRGPFRKKKIMDNKPLSKFSDEKGKLKDINDLSVFKKIEIIDPIIRSAVEAVKKAKSDGFTRKEMEIELRNKGWTEKQIQDIMKYVF